jgi:hypothetical protein
MLMMFKFFLRRYLMGNLKHLMVTGHLQYLMRGLAR